MVNEGGDQEQPVMKPLDRRVNIEPRLNDKFVHYDTYPIDTSKPGLSKPGDTAQQKREKGYLENAAEQVSQGNVSSVGPEK